MKPIHALAAIALLAGCSQQAYVKGQQFCQAASAAGPLVVALADANGAPVTVTNRAAADVAAACAVWNIAAVPVPPPSTAVATVAVPPPTK